MALRNPIVLSTTGVLEELPSTDTLPLGGVLKFFKENGSQDDIDLVNDALKFFKEDASQDNIDLTTSTNTYTGPLLFEDQTGTSYTTVSGDAYAMVTMNNASANTITIPPNSTVAYDIGTEIHIHQKGAGQTTVVQGSGVTINKPSTLILRVQYSSVTVIKTATNTWILMGDTT